MSYKEDYPDFPDQVYAFRNEHGDIEVALDENEMPAGVDAASYFLDQMGTVEANHMKFVPDKGGEG